MGGAWEWWLVRERGNDDEPQGFSPGQSEIGGRSSGNLIETSSVSVSTCGGGLVKHTLEEEGAVETDPLGGEGFLDRCTVGSGVDGIVLGLDGLRGWHSFVCKMGA